MQEVPPTNSPNFMSGYPVGDMPGTPNVAPAPPIPMPFDPRMNAPVPPGFIPPPALPPGPMMGGAPIPFGMPPAPYPFAPQPGM